MTGVPAVLVVALLASPAAPASAPAALRWEPAATRGEGTQILGDEARAGDGPAASRAELLRQARLARMDEREPARRASGLEEYLFFLENERLYQKWVTGWHGLHPAMGGFPSGTGFAFGVLFEDLNVGSYYAHDDDPNRLDVFASARYSLQGYRRFDGVVALRNLGGVPVNASLEASDRHYPQEDFFGLGPDSRRDDRASFLLDDTAVTGRLWWQLPPWLRAGVSVGHLDPRVEEGEDDRFPSIGEAFDPAAVPGLDLQPGFTVFGGFVEIDLRDQPDYPDAGGRGHVEVLRYRDRDLDRFGFTRVQVDVEGFVPLLRGQRVIALRARTTFTEPDEDNLVPFYLQPTLGGSTTLRGFREYRFRGRNALLLTAEYRWEAWWGLDGALFADAGKVFAEPGDVDLADLELSYGAGLRWKTATAQVMRWDVAFGREGPRLHFTFDRVF